MEFQDIYPSLENNAEAAVFWNSMQKVQEIQYCSKQQSEWWQIQTKTKTIENKSAKIAGCLSDPSLGLA